MQKCVVSLIGKGTKKAMTKESAPESVPSTSTGNEAVKLTLSDCLACSGCITTAETMLMEQQSYATVQDALCNKV